jgi:hypothetical protein
MLFIKCYYGLKFIRFSSRSYEKNVEKRMMKAIADYKAGKPVKGKVPI